MWKCSDNGNIAEFLRYLDESRSMIDIRDHLGRSLLHVAVGPGHYSFAKCLLHAGFDPNCKEHCGAIPLSLAVIKNNPKMCELFVRSDANARGPLYVEIPSPYDMARKLKDAELLKVLNPDESDEEDNFVSNYDSALFRDQCKRKSLMNKMMILSVPLIGHQRDF